MKKFIEDLKQELNKLKISEHEINEILSDHEEMIEEAKRDGLNEEELNIKFGEPKKVARELYQDLLKTQGNDNIGTKETDYKGFELYKTFPILDDVEEINIVLVNEDIVYIPSEQESIEVYAKNLRKEENYNIEYEEGKFTLERLHSKKMIQLFKNSSHTEFIVKVPLIELKQFNITVISGDFEVNGVTTLECKIKSTSGDGELHNILVNETLSINTVSGDMELVKVSANNMEIALVSGDAEIEETQITNELHINTVSGDADIKNSSADLINFRSVSGDFEGKEVYANRVQVKTVSGDFDIENSEKDHEIIVVSKKTVSGDVTIK